MRKLMILAFMLFIMGAAYADFLLEQANVLISNIQPDGSAQVHETIQMIITGNYSTALYDSGLYNDTISYWSSSTGLSDAKLHINPATVDIEDLRIRPQPRTQCDPIENLCHGELVLDYEAKPLYNGTTVIPGTGIFSTSNPKPRTIRYTVNPQALSFGISNNNSVLLGDRVQLTIAMPASAVIQDINPEATSQSEMSGIQSLSWSNIVLVDFSLVFDVEGTVGQEVADFFTNGISDFISLLMGPEGLATLALIVILGGSFLYITTAKRRGED